MRNLLEGQSFVYFEEIAPTRRGTTTTTTAAAAATTTTTTR